MKPSIFSQPEKFPIWKTVNTFSTKKEINENIENHIDLEFAKFVYSNDMIAKKDDNISL